MEGNDTHDRYDGMKRLYLAGLLVVLVGSIACEETSETSGFGPLRASIHADGGPPYTDALLSGGATQRHPDGVTVTFAWSWDLDGNPSGITTQTVGPANTTKGQTWKVTVQADYGSGMSAPETAEITIVNKLPEINSLTFNPARPTVDDTISVVLDVEDADGDTINLSYQWFIGGVLVATTATLDSSLTSLFDAMTVEVTPSDADGAGDTFTSPRTFIRAAPTPATVPTTDSEAATSRNGDPAAADEVVLAAGQRQSGIPAPSPERRRPISISESNACHIAFDGWLECGGIEDFALTEPPAGSFSQVVVELDYACAISDADQSIHCWGKPVTDLGQLLPPEGSFSLIDLGSATGCGLRSSGEVACWGDDSLGQASAPEGRFVYLDVSDSYGCAIGEDGVVDCWGLLE